MVIGGYGGEEFLSEVEIHDVDDPADECVDPPSMPFGRSAPEAQVVVMTGDDGQETRHLLVCGGYVDESGDDFGATDDCSRYDFDRDVWIPDAPMRRQRFDPESILLDSGEMVVAGGKAADNVWLADSEVYSDGDWSDFDQLRLPDGGLYHYCLLRINASLAMLIGGMSGGTDEDDMSADAYFLDTTDYSWTRVPSMATPKAGLGCGFVVNGEGAQEVVAQYGNDTEIFSLRSLEWREGPPMPQDVRYAGSGQLETTFAVFGSNQPSDTIYLFDEVNYDWILLENRLAEPKFNVKVLPIPDEYLNCDSTSK